MRKFASLPRALSSSIRSLATKSHDSHCSLSVSFSSSSCSSHAAFFSLFPEHCSRERKKNFLVFFYYFFPLLLLRRESFAHLLPRALFVDRLPLKTAPDVLDASQKDEEKRIVMSIISNGILWIAKDPNEVLQ